MDIGKIPILAIGVSIAIVIVSMVAIPIFDSMSYDVKKVSQENPSGYYEMIDQNEEVTVSFKNTSKIITVNGQEITADSYGLVIISDQATIGLIPQTSSYWQFVTTAFANKIDISTGATTVYEGIITASDGVMTCKVIRTESGGDPTTTNEATMSYDYLFVPTSSSNNSKDVYCQYGNVLTTSAYANIGSDIFVYKNGGVFSNSYQLTKITTGSTTATINKFTLSTPGSTTTVTGPTALNLTLSWSEVDDTDSYKLTSAKVTDGDTQADVTSGLVPKNYYIIEENSMSTIIDIIPILLIVALLIGIVAAAFTRIN